MDRDLDAFEIIDETEGLVHTFVDRSGMSAGEAADQWSTSGDVELIASSRFINPDDPTVSMDDLRRLAPRDGVPA